MIPWLAFMNIKLTYNWERSEQNIKHWVTNVCKKGCTCDNKNLINLVNLNLNLNLI